MGESKSDQSKSYLKNQKEETNFKLKSLKKIILYLGWWILAFLHASSNRHEAFSYKIHNTRAQDRATE